MIDLTVELEAASTLGARLPAMALFDIKRASPTDTWMRDVFDTISMPPWVSNARLALLFGGMELYNCRWRRHVSCGKGASTPQEQAGVPEERRSAWAILFDPMVRKMAEGSRGIPSKPGVFTDDVVVAMHALLRASCAPCLRSSASFA